MLRFKPFTPPKRFAFKDPDTGKMYEAPNEIELVKQIIQYRVNNNLEPIEQLQAIIQHYLCSLPENDGKCEDVKLKRGFVPSIKGGILLLTNYMYDAFATQAVADARSDICASCPLNQDTEKDLLTKTGDFIAINMVGDRKSRNHDKLYTCMGCGCPLKGKVFYQGKVSLTEEQLGKMSDANSNCWQVKEHNG